MQFYLKKILIKVKDLPNKKRKFLLKENYFKVLQHFRMIKKHKAMPRENKGQNLISTLKVYKKIERINVLKCIKNSAVLKIKRIKPKTQQAIYLT